MDCLHIKRIVIVLIIVVGLLLCVVLPIYIDHEISLGINDSILIRDKKKIKHQMDSTRLKRGSPQGFESPSTSGYNADPMIKQRDLAKKDDDDDDEDLYDEFLNRTLSGDSFFEINMFNITNPEEILKGAKPKLKEVGPFVYRQFEYRFDLEFDEKNDLLKYRQHVVNIYDKELTYKATNGLIDGTDSDYKFVVVNLLFVAMKSVVGNVFWHLICDYLLWFDDYDRLFEVRSVKEVLYGYETTIPFLPFIRLKFPGLFPNKKKEEDDDYIHKSTLIIGNKYRNRLFEMIRWRDMEELKIRCPYGNNPLDPDCNAKSTPCCATSKPYTAPWSYDPAFKNEWDGNPNKIMGTNGERFRPHLHPGATVKIFFDLAQRVVRMISDPHEKVPEYKGVGNLIRLRPEPDFWANSTIRPANSRYYQFGPNGLLNISILNEGVPLFVSKVHFLESDPKLLEGVEGLSPNKTLHDLYIEVEPHVGATIVEQNRAMVSTFIGPAHGVPFVDGGYMPHVKPTYIPIAWFNLKSLASQKSADDIKQIYAAKDLQRNATIVGLLLVLTGVILGLKYF